MPKQIDRNERGAWVIPTFTALQSYSMAERAFLT